MFDSGAKLTASEYNTLINNIKAEINGSSRRN
jgi:hypothetical protein